MVKKKKTFPPFSFAGNQVAANCQKPTPENDVRVLKLDLELFQGTSGRVYPVHVRVLPWYLAGVFGWDS